MANKLAVKVEVIESERGWGQKVDDYMVCLSMEDAEKFRSEFNADNNKEEVPDWYMRADSITPISLTPEQFKKVSRRRHKRVWLSLLK